MQEFGTGKRYQSPVLRKLTFEEAKHLLQTRMRDLLDVIVPGAHERRKQSENGEVGCGRSNGLLPYTRPVARKLTTEQARLLLVGHASLGDPGARDLMNLIFPEPDPGIQGGAPKAAVNQAQRLDAQEKTSSASRGFLSSIFRRYPRPDVHTDRFRGSE